MNRPAPQEAANRLQLDYARIRAYSLELVRGLSAEDCQLQSMPDASPLKWHLAHTTWFFETFVLASLPEPPSVVDPSYKVLFNSYYVGIGERHLRAERGLLSRPTLDEVLHYRRQVDQQMQRALADCQPSTSLAALVTLGLQHEQQHQELMLTDLKHHFYCNPLLPAWRDDAPERASAAGTNQPHAYRRFQGGLCEIGASDQHFSYDNEDPCHKVWLEPFLLGERNVSNRDFVAFIEDGGYQRPELWLSDGWDWVCRQQMQAPLYWQRGPGQDWQAFTLAGLQALSCDAPVSHVSLYEADAYARWAGARLPTEAEWEHAARTEPELAGLFGEVWQWTNSAYLPYPGYQPAAGAVGEYNGKFMINQMVLRGSSCATPTGHSRPSYRNFFPAAAQWQFSGLRLARNP
ncbi:ergothioneine biosynthesis protein EgtB [Halopseudomonas pachastrellae]|uniref:ergothioneine biosynthesis protein EgtB n=1 Tax=Halopseudomonas pachastrellae TaxID=254161 RepID=UPI003D7DF586